MARENEWDRLGSEQSRRLSAGAWAYLRVTLLFGSAAVAMALIVAPIAENYAGPICQRRPAEGWI